MQSLRRKILSRYLDRVKLPPQLQEGKSCAVLVTQGDSCVVQALMDSFARRSGRGEVGRYLSVESLGDEGALRWVTVHDTTTLSKALEDNREQSFSTLNIFERKGPVRNNPSSYMGVAQILRILLFSRSLVLAIGTPLKLGSLDTDEVSPAARLQRLLKLDFYRNLKLVRGTPFQSIEAQARTALSGADFERELSLIANKQKISYEQALAMARKEFHAVAANPVRPLYTVAQRVGKFLINRLFSQVVTVGLDRLDAIAREQTVVLVPMHRSHLDYILVGHVLFEANMNPPVVAAGVNLAFWPVGWIIRSLGAYFVRRNARHDRIHALVLRRYVTYLVKRGHLQEFFIEGGRSRSGRMRAPKVGLLSVMVEACLKGLRKDIHFVPVSISYENVVEDRSYGDENTGKAKKNESLFELLKARRIFRKSYGEVVIHFGEPISARALAATPLAESRGLIRELADQLTEQIREQTSPTLTGMIYTALMIAPRYGRSRVDLERSLRELATLSSIAQGISNGVAHPTPALKSFMAGNTTVLDQIERSGIVSTNEVLGEQMFFIRGEKRYTADFYKNGLLHLFFYPALIGLTGSIKPRFDSAEVSRWYKIFAADFLLGSEEHFKTRVQSWLNALTQRGLIVEVGDGIYQLQSGSMRELATGILAAPVQSIMWSWNNLKRLCDTDGFIGYKVLVKHLQEDFRAATYLGKVNRTEAASQSSLASAFEVLAGLGLIFVTDQNGSPHKVQRCKDTAPELQLLEQAERIFVTQ